MMTNLSNGDAILRSFTKQIRQNMAISLKRIFYPDLSLAWSKIAEISENQTEIRLKY